MRCLGDVGFVGHLGVGNVIKFGVVGMLEVVGVGVVGILGCFTLESVGSCWVVGCCGCVCFEGGRFGNVGRVG